MLPTVAPFLEELQGLRPRSKVAAAFGSYGWGGGAVKAIEEKLGKAGMEIVAPALAVKWVPDIDELKKCSEFGKEIAMRVAISK
ncbi:MAG: flavodoxin domain-containing protein [Candidatus Bathyarchaeota archaeon]